VHAHFLYSDGAVALRLNESRGVPYVVAVRNTDLYAFMRYRPDLNGIRDRVLSHASRVVFLSQAYRDALERRLHRAMRDRIAGKSIVIPNGVKRDWLEPPPRREDDQSRLLRLLYVGDVSPNKNLRRLLDAAARLASMRPVRLTLVGGGGDEGAMAGLIASGRFPFVTLRGRIEDPSALREVYRQHDVFVMPSRRETFGVVYVEALSQGLPVVHSRGQGVDGYFQPGTVAEAVDPDDPADIAAKVEALADRLPGVRKACVREAARFDWGRIAQSYAQVYEAAAAPTRPE
jgi:glycosyltransferase involved in cell wall biosynthesis